MAATAKLQYRDAVVDYLDQAHLTAMAGQPRIDLGLQVVIDALIDRAVFVDHRHLGIRRLDRQLAAHAVGRVIDHGIFQKRFADRIDPGGEAGQGNRGIVRLLLARLAVGDTGFGVLAARLGDEDTDADARGVLLAQQISQIIVGSVGNGNGAHGNSSQTCTQCTPTAGLR
ncbi:hypothetical protein D3C80_1527190 [compost metagenome]